MQCPECGATVPPRAMRCGCGHDLNTPFGARLEVVLLNRQIAFLDRLVRELEQQTGRRIRRQEIVPILLDALTESTGLIARSVLTAEMARHLGRRK